MRVPPGLLVGAVLLLSALPSPLAGANHVPPGATVVELPTLPGGEQEWLCHGAIFWPNATQLGSSCRFWCLTDGGCAVFYKDFDYLADYPFDIEFVTIDNVLVRRSSADGGGYVCMMWWEMLDLHFTFFPGVVGPGTVGHAFAVKDEGQFCPW